MPLMQFAWGWNQTSPLCRGSNARTRSWQEGWRSSPDLLAACMHAFRCHSVPIVSKYAAMRELLDSLSPGYKTCYVLFTQH